MPFEDAQIEDGTGKATAVVYEVPSVVASWLQAEGKGVFAGAGDEAQMQALIWATRLAEKELRRWFRGLSKVKGQGLLFPALGARDARRHLIPEDEQPPRSYLEGIRLLAEAAAAGQLMPFAGGPPVEEEQTKRGAVKYRQGTDLSSLRSNHPDAFDLIAEVFPAL